MFWGHIIAFIMALIFSIINAAALQKIYYLSMYSIFQVNLSIVFFIALSVFAYTLKNTDWYVQEMTPFDLIGNMTARSITLWIFVGVVWCLT